MPRQKARKSLVKKSMEENGKRILLERAVSGCQTKQKTRCDCPTQKDTEDENRPHFKVHDLI